MIPPPEDNIIGKVLPASMHVISNSNFIAAVRNALLIHLINEWMK